jgi:uncharacterized protein with NRDE domain
MCVVAAAFDIHPEYGLVLAANRDEFHDRPSAPLARWAGEDSHILAGRDLQSGGTWLGVSEQGRVAVITNIRTGGMPDPDKASRGELVTDYLCGKGERALAALDRYNPFSLLTIGPEGAMLSANRPAPLTEALAPGIHGLSNGEPNASWPRKERLMQAFSECLTSKTDLREALFALLAGVSIDDSIFIRNAVYGTRCSTVVLVDRSGRGSIIERRFDQSGNATGENAIAFFMNCVPSPTDL